MRVNVPEKNTYIDFPDGTSPDVIKRTIDTNWDKFVSKAPPEQDTALLDALEYGGKAKLYPAKEVGKDIVAGAESALSTASGLLATPVAGLAGVVTSAGMLYPEKGAQTVENVTKALTYKPQFDPEKSQQISEVIQKPLELLDTGTGWVGEKVSDYTGSPVAGAVTKTGLMMAIPAGLGKIAKLALSDVAGKIPDVAQRDAFISDVVKEAKETGIPVEDVVQKKVSSILEGFDKETPPSNVIKSPEMANDVTTFADRIVNGEKITTPEDFQFYDNNKAAIEAELTRRQKASETSPAGDMGANTTEPIKTSQEGVQANVGEIESRLSLRTEADAIEKKLTQDFGELAGYDRMNMKQQAEMAKAVMDADYEAAKRMAMGEQPPPEGLREASIYEGVKLRALAEGDVETLRKLATDSTIPTKLSEYGQAIKAADSALENDPVRAMLDVANVRKETAKRTGKKPAGNIDLLEEIAETKRSAFEEHINKGAGGYGSGNRIITQDVYIQAKNELRSKMGSLSAGVDPTAMASLSKIGVYHLEAGARAFAKWSARMVEDAGAWVKPYLPELWEQSRKTLREELAPERALKTAKTRMRNETAQLEEKMSNLDFSKKERRTTVLDAEGRKLKAEYERAKQAHKAASEAAGIVTREEAAKIVEMSKEVSAAREAMEAGGDRFAYGSSRVAYENYINDLKGESAPISTLLKNRALEAKTTWGENKARAIYEGGRDTLKTIVDNSISMVATLDNSFLGRQGLHTLMTHPTVWAKGARHSFIDFAKTMGGKNSRDALMADIYSRENYLNGAYEKAKIIPKTEEQFPTSLPERIPGVGRVFKASENTFTGSALRMRTGLYDLLDKMARENGVDMTNKAQIQSLGKMINSLTARGQWGKVGEPAVVRLVMWAPKMLKGNLDVLTAHNLGSGLESAFARKQAAINLLKIVGETATVLTIADALMPGSVEWDPRSSDFGKIKVGKTRFDITAGAASIVTLASRIATRSSKSTMTGKVKPYGFKYGQRSPFDALIDFLVNKETPPARVVTDWLRGKDFKGEKFSPAKAAYQASTPISIQQAIELKDDASADRIAGLITDVFGISANTYDNKAKKRRYP